ncbi:type II toxin-antitoxin system Phd/YefM family antitoxin [Mesorhizobium australicum]|uniref:Antitoxin n=1 Tax=Mesorhizobium australicum TaxID=536018 RepID=A0A1X7NU59_9HYPH|nr:type II toxin-antitoxin system Phd/YefM family antitoxin [Mesorhizobium australicum]SMH41327.1 prevent-host-death family protein [Mesorhizobium australicum]
MRKVDMLEAKNSLSRLVKAVESGAEPEIIIARNGKPAVRIVPMSHARKRGIVLGLLEGKHPPMTLEQLNSTDAEIAALFEASEIEPPR